MERRKRRRESGGEGSQNVTHFELRETVQSRHSRRLDASLTFLERVTPEHVAIVLDYSWGDCDGAAGALLGVFPEQHDGPGAYIEVWRQADAA
ncbi:MAG: hypothetical protein ACRD1H_05025, partial [Vicinamibacterales bacterium]